MNKKIISGFLMFALAVFSMSSFVACKDYDEDSYSDLKARLNGEITLREALAAQVKALEEALAKVKQCSCDPTKYASQEEFNKVELKLKDYEKDIQDLKDALSKITPYDDKELIKKINEMNQKLLYVEALAKSDSVRIDNLEGKVNNLEGAVAGWNGTVTKLVQRVDSIVVALSKLNNGCDSICKANIAKAQHTADSAANLAGKAMEKALEALDLAKKDSVRLDNLEKKFNDLIIRDFSKEIDSLCKVTDSLATEMNKIKADLQNMVTSVVIQGTESPVIGYFNTPLDARALILAAYYGELESALEFPATKANNYVNGDADLAMWTERNKTIIGNFSSVRGYIANQPAARFVGTNNGKEFGNAGTLYVTVNPNTVDFTGKKVALETSLGKESFIELSTLKHSTRELTFGFTRAAAADNGFYEAQATLAKQNIDKVKMNIKYDELKDRAKDLLKEKNKSSVLAMGYALISSLEDVMPAYGVKAAWQDSTTNTVHNVYSEYALANTAIKPFSYTFLKDFNVSLPGEDKIQDVIGKIIDKININFGIDFSKFENVNINLDRGTKDYTINVAVTVPVNQTVTFSVPATVPGQTISVSWTDGYGPHTATGSTTAQTITVDGEVTLNFSLNANAVANINTVIDDLYASLNGDLAKVNDMLNEVAKLSKLQGNIDTTKGEIKAQLNSYVTRAYNKINAFLSSAPNKALQPILIGKSGDKAFMLSQSLYMPTKVSSKELTIVPTSYSLELLAPAYKKFVAVTDVFNASTKAAVELSQAKTMANQANMGDNMKRVFDVESTCKFKGESGFIYEITYTAVDYHGKIAIKKFYVQF